MLAGSQEGLAPLSGRCCPYLIFLPTHSTEASIFFEESLIVKTAVTALASVRTGERDVLSGIRPGHLVALVLHILNKALPVSRVLQCFIDGLNEIQFQLSARRPA